MISKLIYLLTILLFLNYKVSIGINKNPIIYDPKISIIIKKYSNSELHYSLPGHTLPNYNDEKRSLWDVL